jgi:hypothetical protein
MSQEKHLLNYPSPLNAPALGVASCNGKASGSAWPIGTDELSSSATIHDINAI